VRFVIAELESGIAIWEKEINPNVNYMELQPGFHSFTVDGQKMAVQFADAVEALSFYNSLKDYIAQKESIDKVLEEKRAKSSKKEEKKKSAKKRSASFKGGISKLDISAPCEFRHLSGITSGHTEVCQRELEGTIERSKRSASMGALSSKNVKQRGRIPDDMNDGSLYLKKNEKETTTKRQPTNQNGRKGIFKFHSMRLTNKKPLVDQTTTIRDQTDDDVSTPVKRKNSMPSISSSSLPPLSDNENSTINGSIITVPQGWESPNEHEKSLSPSREPLQPVPFSKQQLNRYKPSFNTYDTLEPLDTTNQPKKVLSAPGKHGAPHLMAMMSAYRQQAENNPPPNLPTNNAHVSPPVATSSSPTSISPVHGSKSPSMISPSPRLSVSPDHKESDTASPDGIISRSSKDLDNLGEELTRVLREFDQLITPMSPPLAGSFFFQQPQAIGKETMV
jgi:hypothetical protein